MQFNSRRHDALHTNTIAPHHNGNLLTVLRQDSRAHRRGVFRAELKDMTNLQRLCDFKSALVTLRTAFARTDSSQISPLINLDVALNVYASDMIVVSISTCSHIPTTA